MRRLRKVFVISRVEYSQQTATVSLAAKIAATPMKIHVSFSKLKLPAALTLLSLLLCPFSLAEEPAKQEKPAAQENKVETPKVEISKDGDEVTLPGLRVFAKKGYVDVDAKVCLAEGFLELVACTKDSKEHEALISIEAKAAHVHAALLLIGAQPGNPAMRKQVETENGPRWLDIMPRGQEIDVFLVFNNKKGELEELPINKFLIRGLDERYDGAPIETDKKEDRSFPTHTFLFVGSHVFKDGERDPVYLADESGNVISISTFGDELLALPDVHGHSNDALEWSVDSTHLPPLDSKVILRLKPKKPVAAPANPTENPKK